MNAPTSCRCTAHCMRSPSPTSAGWLPKRARQRGGGTRAHAHEHAHTHADRSTRTHTQTNTRAHTHTPLPTLWQGPPQFASLSSTSFLEFCSNRTAFAKHLQSYVTARISHHRSHFGSRYLTRADAATQAFFAFLLRVFGKQPSMDLAFEFICHKMPLGPLIVASGHTASNAPDLFRTPKLSGAGPG